MFNTIDLKAKLTSRKLWVGIILVVIGGVLCVCGDVENGMMLISVGGGVYIGAECIVDVARIVFDGGAYIVTADVDTTSE